LTRRCDWRIHDLVAGSHPAIHVPAAYLDETRRYYRTFDEGMIEANRAVHMLGRSDDVIKVAGRRISGVQIEKIIASHPAVHACAVVATPDELRGQRPVAYVVPDSEAEWHFLPRKS